MPDTEQFFIYKEDIPQSGNIIIHFDSHPDILIPSKNNWILDEACKGFFSTLVWIKPPWSQQIRDGSYPLTIGKDDSGMIGVYSNLPIFVSNCTYKPLSELRTTKEVLLEVNTFGKFVKSRTESDDFNCFLERIKERFPDSGHYFLNVDLDFFSTCNPYEKVYEKAQLYDQLIELYWFGVNENMSDSELLESLNTRKNQLRDLENLWKHVAEKGVDSDPPKSDLWNELKPIAKALLSKYSNIDWELIHTSGCTWNEKGDPLVQHITPRDDVKKLIHTTFGGFISRLIRKPAAITIPMLDNNYCPLEDEDFIYKELISAIESRFGIQINEHYLS